MGKAKKLVFLFFLVSILILPLARQGVSASGAVTDTISIHIGYFGWTEEQFIEKVTYHWRELDSLFGGILDTHELVYSYYSGGRTYHAAARGIYIKDLLELAGIDFGSISSIDFFTRDQTIGAYRSFTKSSLFDMPRYYFPYLAADEETGEPYAYHGGDLYDGAVRVESMLALEDITIWDNVGYMFEETYDRNMFSTGNRFHLFFGQLSPQDANTSSAAKYVYKLFITFTGTPVLSTEDSNIELIVGNNFRMIVNASAEDALLNAYVEDNLTWTSDDESVVTVDAFGNLTVIAEGQATITASFGVASVSAVVQVSSEVIVPDAPSGDSAISSSSGSNGDGDGDGNGDGSGFYETDEFTSVDDIVEDITVPIRNEPEIVTIDNSRNMFILSSELMNREEYAAWVSRVLGRSYIDDNDDGALSGSRGGGMGADAEVLILPFHDNPVYFLPVASALIVFFLLGFAYGTFSFRRKIRL